MSEQAKTPEFKDINKNGTNLDELQASMKNSAYISADVLMQYAESLNGSKNLIKEEARQKASEYLKKILEQKLTSGLYVTEPDSLDVFIKSGLYKDIMDLPRMKAQFAEIKTAAQKLVSHGVAVDKVVFELKKENGKYLWNNCSGPRFAEYKYEKNYGNVQTDLTDKEINSDEDEDTPYKAKYEQEMFGMHATPKIAKKAKAKAIKRENPFDVMITGIHPTQSISVAAAPRSAEPAKTRAKHKKAPVHAKAKSEHREQKVEIKEGEAIVSTKKGELYIRNEKGEKIDSISKGAHLNLTGESIKIKGNDYIGVFLDNGKKGYAAKEFLTINEVKASKKEDKKPQTDAQLVKSSDVPEKPKTKVQEIVKEAEKSKETPQNTKENLQKALCAIKEKDLDSIGLGNTFFGWDKGLELSEKPIYLDYDGTINGTIESIDGGKLRVVLDDKAKTEIIGNDAFETMKSAWLKIKDIKAKENAEWRKEQEEEDRKRSLYGS